MATFLVGQKDSRSFREGKDRGKEGKDREKEGKDREKEGRDRKKEGKWCKERQPKEAGRGREKPREVEEIYEGCCKIGLEGKEEGSRAGGRSCKRVVCVGGRKRGKEGTRRGHGSGGSYELKVRSTRKSP